jgi:hypothetical protein
MASKSCPSASAERGFRRDRPGRPEKAHMRAMLVVWGVVIVGGIVFFSVVGLTHG